MKELHLGIIGLGNMGTAHAASVLAGKIPRCRLSAVCDEEAGKLAAYPEIPGYTDSRALIQSGKVDAVLIATPHYSHTPIGVAALKAGLHVLVEKPISVHKADCERLIAAHQSKKQIFAAMFNQRTDSVYQKIRELVKGRELGKIRRVTWTITDWFRSQTYYDSGGWRATWAGEGGGVLLNQCPHNLDLYQWIFGMPAKVRGFCKFGHFHNIEVEDDVTAYFEYPDGASAVFITSTGEAPGANRLEISAEQGRLVMEGGKLTFTRNEIPMTEFSKTTKTRFERPAIWNVEIPVIQQGEQHIGILKNFTQAVLDGTKLVAPAAEGIHSVELGNAILMSSMLGETVEIPFASAKFEKLLKKLIVTSRFKKKTVRQKSVEDFSKSF
ncbi:MAG: Gfo/Idh/MocA family oxidoreductase [Chthoniobacterales bacterium]|nr:Gfo/Idh/MocA family oxidoreductase [Chthoniobacterales bacterium]